MKTLYRFAGSASPGPPARYLPMPFCVILFFLGPWLVGPAYGQPIAYHFQGKVLSTHTNESLPGASVQLKGTRQGTTTDAEGAFTLSAADSRVTLRVSFIGYHTLDTLLQLPLTRELLLTLKPDEAMLEEVTVSTGYWESTKRLSTGNISKVTAETIEKQPVSNVLSALIGRMPGVNIRQTTGIPGGSLSLQIRGRNSLRSNGNNPLIVIDGVPFDLESMDQLGGQLYSSGSNPLEGLNPSDIASVEVLKDADATAIYGSRGGNGVILITTKRGTREKIKSEVNLSQGFGRISGKVSLLDTPQYLEMRREAFQNDHAEPQPYDYDINGTWDQNRYTDWQKVLLGGTALTSRGQLSVYGGTGHTNFRISGGVYRETSVFPGDFSYLKKSVQANMNHQSENGKLQLSFSASYLSDLNRQSREDLTRHALILPPNAPALFTPEGTLNWEGTTWQNPLSYIVRKYRAESDYLVSAGTASFQVSPRLKFKTNLGFTTTQITQFTGTPISYYNPAYAVQTGIAQFADGSRRTWLAEPQAEYGFALRDSRFSALVGATFQQNTSHSRSLQGSGYIHDMLLENLQAASVVTVYADNYNVYRTQGFYARLNYNLYERYVLNLTARSDGSSRFGPGKRYARFGAIGAAWIFSEEPWAKGMLAFIDHGKIRASYGITGSDQIGDYGYLETYVATATYNGDKGLAPSRLANPDYAWEINRKMEVALEARLFKGVIDLGASWYGNRSSSQLVGYPLSLVTGFPSIQYNLPATVSNTGLEFELGIQEPGQKKFKWEVRLNLALPRSKLLRYPNLDGSPDANRYEVGKSLNITKKYRYTGLDPEEGIFTFQDIDGGGLRYPNDLQAIKSVEQRFLGGLQHTIVVWGLELEGFWQYVGQSGFNYLYGPFSMAGAYGNQPSEVMGRWQQPGDLSRFPRFSQDRTLGNPAYNQFSNAQSYGDNVIGNTSFLRLKNLSLSYSLPKGRYPKTRLYVQGQNLLTFSRHWALDPEQAFVQNLPSLKTLLLGLQLTL